VVTRGVPDLRLDLQYHCGSLTYKGRVFRSVCNPNLVTGPALREQIELRALLTQLPEGLFGRGLAHGGFRSDWVTHTPHRNHGQRPDLSTRAPPTLRPGLEPNGAPCNRLVLAGDPSVPQQATDEDNLG